MISVVVPVYNMEKYIHDTIQSVLNQTHKDFELIISDDGSTDRSLDIAAGFNDPRIRILPHPMNTGAVVALNRGIEASQGSYITLLSGDDLFTKDSLELRLTNIGDHSLICGQILRIRSYNTLDDAYALSLRRIEGMRYFYGPSNMLRRDVFQQYGLFDESLYKSFGADREMWVRLFGRDRNRTDRGTFICLEDIVGYFRVRKNSIQYAMKRLPLSKKDMVRRNIQAAIESRLESIGPDIRRLHGN